MGKLKDLASSNSKFLMIEKNGGSVVVEYRDYQIVPNPRDPDLKQVQYCFRIPGDMQGKNKYWTNSATHIMMFFDDLKPGELVKITRNPWKNKDETIDPSKSAYLVEKVGIPGDE